MPDSGKFHQGQEVYDVGGVAPTIRSEAHGKLPMIKEIFNEPTGCIIHESERFGGTKIIGGVLISIESGEEICRSCSGRRNL